MFVFPRAGCSFRILFGIALIPVLMLPTSVRGGLIAGDTNAMDTWHSTLTFTGSSDPEYPPVYYLYANIDYAVYVPGQFNLSFSGQDPSSGTQYVYAYQLFNDPHVPASTDTGILKFTVGVHSDELTADVRIGQVDDPTTTSDKTSTPAWAGSPIATSATWKFSGSNQIALNYRSKILIFTSEYGPRWDSANLFGVKGSTAPENQYIMPSPIPEPAIPLILAIAGGLFLLIRKLRSSVFA